MTLPGFVERRQVVASLPSLAILTLGGLTPDGGELEYHEVPDIRLLDRLPGCDLAAISTYTAQVKDAYELARGYRAEGVKTVIGGLHITVLPAQALQHCDVEVVGEGELSWPSVVRDFEPARSSGSMPPKGREPVVFPGIQQIEAWERAFAKSNSDGANTARLSVDCEFSASSLLPSSHYTLKPIAKAIWSRPFIEFADDNTFVNKARGKQFMRALAAEDVRRFTETDTSVAEDDELHLDATHPRSWMPSGTLSVGVGCSMSR